MTTEHAKHTIQVLAKEPVASNSTPETMAPTVPPTISSEVMVPVTLPRSAMPNCLDADGQRRHHADSREHQEGGTPANAHDKRAHDGRQNSAAKARTRKCDGNGKAALGRKPVGGHKADEQAGRGHSEAARNGKEHVDLPQLTDKAHASKHRRGSDNGERAQYAATHLIGNMADNERTHDAHYGGDGIGDVVLRKGNAQVADDQRLE